MEITASYSEEQMMQQGRIPGHSQASREKPLRVFGDFLGTSSQ